MTAPLTLRPIVQAFAEAMEGKLRYTDWKGGWDDVDMFWLTAKAAEELGEWSRGLIRKDPQAIEAVDLANIAMMLWDKVQKGSSPGGEKQ